MCVSARARVRVCYVVVIRMVLDVWVCCFCVWFQLVLCYDAPFEIIFNWPLFCVFVSQLSTLYFSY